MRCDLPRGVAHISKPLDQLWELIEGRVGRAEFGDSGRASGDHMTVATKLFAQLEATVESGRFAEAAAIKRQLMACGFEVLWWPRRSRARGPAAAQGVSFGARAKETPGRRYSAGGSCSRPVRSTPGRAGDDALPGGPVDGNSSIG